MGELRSNSEIGWDGKKGNQMVKNYRLLMERNKGKRMYIDYIVNIFIYCIYYQF